MVHITYRHGLDRNEEKRVILKEIHFYISDDQTHDIHYVQHCFKLFDDHVIAMDIHFIVISFGRMIVLDSSRMHMYLNGCVCCTKNTRYHMYGTTLKLVMEKESTMVLVHAIKLPFEGKN